MKHSNSQCEGHNHNKLHPDCPTCEEGEHLFPCTCPPLDASVSEEKEGHRSFGLGEPQESSDGWEQRFRKAFVKGHAPIANAHHDVLEAESWVDAEQEDLEAFISTELKKRDERAAKIVDGISCWAHKEVNCSKAEAIAKILNDKHL